MSKDQYTKLNKKVANKIKYLSLNRNPKSAKNYQLSPIYSKIFKQRRLFQEKEIQKINKILINSMIKQLYCNLNNLKMLNLRIIRLDKFKY